MTEIKRRMHESPRGSSHIKTGRSRKWKAVNIGVVVLVVLLLATSIFFGYKYFTSSNTETAGNNAVSSEETGKLLDKLSKIYEVPDREHATAIYIGLPDDVKTAPGLSKAQKGDYYVRFNFDNHGLLYRPSENRIISYVEIGPVVNIYIKNVSEDYAKKVAELMQKASPSLEVRVFQANTTSKGTTVVVNNQKLSESAKQLAAQLGGQVGGLPASETADPIASLQIYLGNEVDLDKLVAQ